MVAVPGVAHQVEAETAAASVAVVAVVVVEAGPDNTVLRV